MTEPPSLTAVEARDAREAAGLTQVEFATMTGLSRATIQNFEQGKPIGHRSLHRLRSAVALLRPPQPTELERLSAEVAELRGIVDQIVAGSAA
jgi:transcriptional regulator with XRE-family HTH domain